MPYQKFELDYTGRKLTVETGHIAEQANGAVLIRSGDTMVLVTAVGATQPREGIDFFPLTCDFEEKLYAAGRIPGSFPRREGRPTEAATLACRLMDRPLRPLFPKDFRNDVQVVATVVSADQENDPVTLAVTGASLALAISDVPHAGPVGCVRVGLIDGRLVLNPTLQELAGSDLDLIVAGTDDAIGMVEAGAMQVPEAVMLQALHLAHDEIRRLVAFQNEIKAKVGKPPMSYPSVGVDPEVKAAVAEAVVGRIGDAARNVDKAARERALDELKKQIVDQLVPRFVDREQEIKKAFEGEVKRAVRGAILDEGIRPDGRRTDEIRHIWSQVGILPRAHGSAPLHPRPDPGAERRHPRFRPGSAEAGRPRSRRVQALHAPLQLPALLGRRGAPAALPGRREIGHGALAERAVHNVMPSDEDFPYVVRIVTEILSSNGSTSMASVCGSTMALMDAGVPLKAPVAGIAMGLITDENSDRAAILSDIQGMEDALGDMDFKVAGTEAGITALQMDMKIKGLRWELMEQALEQARKGRLHILGKMIETLPEPRAEMSMWAPRIETIQINPDKIRDVIGPGGKTIRRIVEETGVQIDVEDDGRVSIASNDGAAMQQAIAMIRDLTEDVEVGKIYKGKVVRIMNFGAFVEILPKKDGLVHISQLADHRVNKVEDVVNIGDEIMVKVIEIDDKGRVNLSRKQAISELAGKQAQAAGAGSGGPA